LKPPKVRTAKPSAAKPTSKASTRNSPRSRPVWRLPHQDGAGRARQGRRFVDDVFGGAIPKNWIPSVEKGIRDAAARGFLAGFRSWISAPSFTTANITMSIRRIWPSRLPARWLSKEAMKQARPALLEPVMHVEVYAPDHYSGDLMGDLRAAGAASPAAKAAATTSSSKRQVPLAEMLSYANDLISKTQGRASYSMEFATPVPLCRTFGEGSLAHKSYGENSME